MVFILQCPRLGGEAIREIRSAYDQNITEVEDIEDLSETSTSSFLGDAKMVVDALDCLRNIHPLLNGVFPTCHLLHIDI